MIYVYEHHRPDKNQCFYVGIGTAKRIREIKRPHNSLHARILAKLTRLGMKCEVRIAAEYQTWNEAAAHEIMLITQYGRRCLGTGTLVNITAGGEGTVGLRHSAESRAKVSIANKGKVPSAETRAKISAANKGQKRSKEFCANLSAKLKGRIFSEESRAKMAAAGKKKVFSPEYRAKLSVAQMGHTRNRGRITSDEAKAKLSIAITGKRRSTETRTRMSEARKRWWANHQINTQLHT